MSSPQKSKNPTKPVNEEPFVYKTDAGDEITVPSMAVAPKPSRTKLLRAAADKNQALIALLLLESAAGDQMDAIDELPGDEQERFMVAWQEHSGISLGESRAS